MFSHQNKIANGTEGNSNPNRQVVDLPNQSAQRRTVVKSLLVCALVAAVCSTGCNLSKSDMAFWKKDDNFRLSANHKEGVAPPSRSFSPAPSQYAQSGSGSATKTTPAKTSGGSGTKLAEKPMRKPYKTGSGTKPNKEVVTSGFGFPQGSKALFDGGEKEDFSLPDAQDFRNAMKGASNKSTQIASNAKTNAAKAARSAENAFQSTREISVVTAVAAPEATAVAVPEVVAIFYPSQPNRSTVLRNLRKSQAALLPQINLPANGKTTFKCHLRPNG